MNYKNEEQLINIIKFTPPIFIITISIIITFFLYLEKQVTFTKEKFIIKNEFIKENKETTKDEVDNLYKFIIKTQEQTEEKIKSNIKSRVQEAHNIAMKIYNENKDSKTKDEIKKLIQDSLVDIRFNDGRGYFFLYSFDYECILLPINREKEGTNFYNYKDANGTFIIREIIKQLKEKKEEFLSWSYHKPEDMETQYKKIGFNMHFEPYDWIIGTGEYIVDFENDVKREILEYLSRINSSDENYYFILNYDKKILFHIKKNLINLPSDEIMTIKNKRIFDDMLYIAKNGEGFISYEYTADDGDTLIKTSYVKGLNNWKWIIAKGFYQNDMEEIIKKKNEKLNNDFHEKILDIISMATILTIVLLLISIYISRLIEKKFKKHKRELQRHINENTKQQHILFQQSKMASMGEMLGNIAHQWRQPLSLITTASTGMKLQKEFGTLDDESFNHSVNNITEAALYLSKTIDDFRNFFKTDKSEIYFDTEEIFEKVFKLTKGQFETNDIVFIQNIEKTQIYGLENELIQALINIFNNAKDALIEMGNSIPRVIFIDVYKENDKIIIKIRDNAGGIDEKIINKVCEPYFTTKHQSKGTGIGLYMTAEIIKKNMDGTFKISNTEVEYENKSYKGIEITIEIPLLIMSI